MKDDTKKLEEEDFEEKCKKEADPLVLPVLCNEDGRADKRPTILLIDKDTFVLAMYSMKFIKEGFNAYTLTTANGDLVQKVLDTKPDIITVEVVMMGRFGTEAVRLLKSDDRTKNIQIVMLTNQAQPSEIEEGKDVGVAGYIIKANTIPSEVVEEVKRLLRTSSLNNGKN